MVDYQGNSKKSKEKPEDPPKKEIQKVVVGEVKVKKKTFGQRIKDTFIAADFQSVARYVVSEVLIPAARNMIVDSATKGVDRLMYGERGSRRTSYSGLSPSRGMYSGSPIRTDYRHPATRPPSPVESHRRLGPQEFILPSHNEAQSVVQSMYDILDQWQVVTVADLNELVGFPSSWNDQKWGWTVLSNVAIVPIREGYILDLPPAQPI